MPDNGKTCTVTFFYVFDLAEFFSKGENSIECEENSIECEESSIEFLDSRTDKRFHQLFSYKDGGVQNGPSNSLEFLNPKTDKTSNNEGSKQNNSQSDNKESKLFTYCEKEWKKEGKAYLAGWVRLNLLHQFFHPTYEFNISNCSTTSCQDGSLLTRNELSANFKGRNVSYWPWKKKTPASSREKYCTRDANKLFVCTGKGCE